MATKLIGVIEIIDMINNTNRYGGKPKNQSPPENGA
jgi:hypothetical protein